MDTQQAIQTAFQQMDDWYQSALGSYLLEVEREELDKFLPNYYGDHLLQIGGPGESFLFENAAISHRVRLSPEHASNFHGPSVQGGIHELPFLEETMDVVLMPHVLEFAQRPDMLLAECYRVLAPAGRLIILGFNPSSLWGLKRYCNQRQALPWKANFKFKNSIKHLLLAQDYEVEHTSSMLFEPPLKKRYWINKLFPMEAVGKICWSNWGAVYMIIAHKNISTPILMPSVEF